MWKASHKLASRQRISGISGRPREMLKAHFQIFFPCNYILSVFVPAIDWKCCVYLGEEMQCLLGQVRKAVFRPHAPVSFLGAQSLWLYGLGCYCFTAAGALLVPPRKQPGRWVLAMALHRNSLAEEPEGV